MARLQALYCSMSVGPRVWEVTKAEGNIIPGLPHPTAWRGRGKG